MMIIDSYFHIMETHSQKNKIKKKSPMFVIVVASVPRTKRLADDSDGL